MGNNASSPSPTPPPTKRRHTKSAGPSTSNASKLRRVSAGQGMTKMATSLADMVKVIKKKRAPKTRVLTPPPTLPQDPLERAIVKLEVDAEFSNNEMMNVIDIFMADQDIARCTPLCRHPECIQPWCSITWRRCRRGRSKRLYNNVDYAVLILVPIHACDFKINSIATDILTK